jgi:hypothetical protein
MSFVFNLNYALQGGKAALDVQLHHAKNMLHMELEKFAKRLPGGEQPISPKPRRQKFLIWIRAYDAVMHKEANKDDVARELYPYLFIGNDHADNNRRARKQLNDDLRKATHMVNSGYLTLIPLDYLKAEFRLAQTLPFSRPPKNFWKVV